MRKLKWQYKENNVPGKRLPAIADRAVREKITRASWNKWDNTVEKIWKGLEGDPEEVLFIEKFNGYKTKVKARIEEKQRLALKNKEKEEKHLAICGGREDIGKRTCTAQ